MGEGHEALEDLAHDLDRRSFGEGFEAQDPPETELLVSGADVLGQPTGERPSKVDGFVLSELVDGETLAMERADERASRRVVVVGEGRDDQQVDSFLGRDLGEIAVVQLDTPGVVAILDRELVEKLHRSFSLAFGGMTPRARSCRCFILASSGVPVPGSAASLELEALTSDQAPFG